MKRFKYSLEEQRINNVLNHHSKELENISVPSSEETEKSISSSEELLHSLGYSTEKKNNPIKTPKKTISLPTWESLCSEAEASVGSDYQLESIFTEEELKSNEEAIRLLNREYNQLNQLDKLDITISAAAGLLGGVIDILLVGIPRKTPQGIKAGKLSNYIRNEFDKKFPPEEMEKLANLSISKVPYDAQDNRNTVEYVSGLSAYYHRLLALGHDPFLGFIVGVADIMKGNMTTIDKAGKFTTQNMDGYAGRVERNIFKAIAKQIIHLKSDMTTSMGIPVPMMGLFNLFQFGSITEEDQTIAEIVQGMYYEGYDFIHFCSMSIPVMVIEVLVRLGYAMKKIKEGHSLSKSIPCSSRQEEKAKLTTMLFISHSSAAAINAGKVCFKGDPKAINYVQWLAFAKYSYQKLKWEIIEKPQKRDKYVMGVIDKEMKSILTEIDKTWSELEQEDIVMTE